MNLRHGQEIGAPLSRSLTKYEHRKLDSFVRAKLRQESHVDQMQKWRLGFVKTYLADEVDRIN